MRLALSLLLREISDFSSKNFQRSFNFPILLKTKFQELPASIEFQHRRQRQRRHRRHHRRHHCRRRLLRLKGEIQKSKHGYIFVRF